MRTTKSWLIVTLLTLTLAACKQEHIIPNQNRVGYSAWRTQVSYTHCEPLPKTGMPEFVSGTWEMNDVKLTVAGDSVKAWLDDELVFDEVLKQINN